MVKQKWKKSNLSNQDKEFIREMKDYLKMMGVPRDQWSKIIQEELMQKKKFKGIQRLQRTGNNPSGVIGTLKGKIGKFVTKATAKRMGVDQNVLNQMTDVFKNPFEGMSGDEMDMLNPFLSDIDFEDVDGLGKDGGTFVMERLDKKRMIVDFDDED